MAQLTPFGATQIADDVKELIDILLRGDDWGMQYSNTEHGYIFKRQGAWNARVTVMGGEREGTVEVIVKRYQEPDGHHVYSGPDAVLDAAKHVLTETRS